MDRDRLVADLYSSEGNTTADVAANLVQHDLCRGSSIPDNPVLPVSFHSETVDQQPSVRIQFSTQASNTDIVISVEEIKDLVKRGRRIDSVLAEKLFNIESQIPDRTPTTYSEFRRPNPREVSEIPSDPVWTVRSRKVLTELRTGENVALIGRQAAGKTVSAVQVTDRLSDFGWSITWLDISMPDIDISDLLRSVILQERGNSHVIVVDNAQSNPEFFIKLCDVFRWFQAHLPDQLRGLITGWQPIKPTIEDKFEKISIFNFSGEDILHDIIKNELGHKVSQEIIKNIREVSGSDLYTVRLCAEYYSANNDYPSRSDLANDFVSDLFSEDVTSNQIRLIYEMVSIGQFGIKIAEEYALSRYPDAFTHLKELNAVQDADGFLSVGHETKCNLILEHLREEYSSVVSDLPTPVQITVQYLEGGSERQLRMALERLDLARLQVQEKSDIRSSFLVRLWWSLQTLTEHLNRQVTEDHTWDENLACSIFSAQALAKISEDGWEKPANFVRSSWAVDDSNRFPVPTDEATKERRDFDHIQERMKKEDAERAPKTIRYPAEKIEPVRFHRTWILGLLLGFEAYAPDGRQGRINTLKQMASAASDPTGWFYPPRAPWSTARVVMGLTAAGENIHSSETVKRACRWLRTPSPEGPFDKDRGIWESGTGTWNTEIETTAMCIIALVKAGVSIDDPTIEQGMEYILDNRDQWTSEGNEVDAVLAIKAHQLVRHNWMNIEDEFYDLINWVERTDRWVEAKTTEEDLDKESYKIPFIADTLIGIIWETLKNELPLLLNSLEPHNSKSDSESDNKGAKKRQVIHEVIKEIENRINRQIEIRRNTLNNSDAHLSSVNDEITHWENKKDQLRDIKIRFNNTTNTTEIPSKLVNDLDELARDCYSNNWTEIEEQIDTDS